MGRRKKSKKDIEKKDREPVEESGIEVDKEKKPHKGKDKEPSLDSKHSAELGRSIVRGIYYSFIFLALFFLWSAYFALTSGSSNQLLLVGLALAGFLLAFLSRQLAQSAYFQLYRVLVLLLFAPIALIYLFRNNMDGFTVGLFGVLGACVLVAAILPYFFEGIKVEKVATYSLSTLIIMGISYLMLATNILLPYERVLFQKGIYPPGIIFRKESNLTWIYGDNSFIKNSKDGSSTFRIITDRHPDAALKKMIEYEKKRQKAMGNRGKKPKKDKKKEKEKKKEPEVEKFPFLSFDGIDFSSCPDREGTKIAVAGSKITAKIMEDRKETDEKPDTEKGKEGNGAEKKVDKEEKKESVHSRNEPLDNSLFIVKLPEMEKIDLLKSTKTKPFLPGFSASYPGYTTWNEDGKRLFFFGHTDDGKLQLFWGDINRKETGRIEMEDALSACWVGSEELRIVTGKKRRPKINYLENFFNFDIENGAIYRWNMGMEKPEKMMDLESEVKQVIVHPLSGRIFTFDGQSISILDPKSNTFDKKTFDKIPGAFTSIISSDGKMLAYNSGGVVRVFDVESGQTTDVEKTSDRTINFTFTGDNRYLLYSSISKDNIIFVYARISIYDFSSKTLKKITPNFMTGDYMAGRILREPIMRAGLVKNGYFYDRYHPAVYFSQINKDKVMSIWKISFLYPEKQKKTEGSKDTTQKKDSSETIKKDRESESMSPSP